MAQKKLIVIAGPTASGKTDLAIQVAQNYNTSIVSADSRQCYTELNIGVAKPTQQQLDTVQHYFINSHSITENINAGTYEKLALDYLNEIFAKNDYAVLVGGTGLYIKSVCEGIDIMPEIDKDIDIQVNDGYTIQGKEWLQTQIQKQDPLFYAKGEIQNPARLIRALTFVLSTGQSILEFQQHAKAIRHFEIIKYCIDIPRQELYDRINTRVDNMIGSGLVEEVNELIPYQHLKNLQTVGYTELFSYFNNELNLDTTVNLIKQNTRHYAKRQVTWFKKDKAFVWGDTNFIFDNCCNL